MVYVNRWGGQWESRFQFYLTTVGMPIFFGGGIIFGLVNGFKGNEEYRYQLFREIMSYAEIADGQKGMSDVDLLDLAKKLELPPEAAFKNNAPFSWGISTSALERALWSYRRSP